MRSMAGRRHSVGSDVLKGEATGKQQLWGEKNVFIPRKQRRAPTQIIERTSKT